MFQDQARDSKALAGKRSTHNQEVPAHSPDSTGRTPMTKVIKNGTIVTADRTWKADVLIDGEKIARIGENLSGDETVDATDAYVIPGGIDPHTHFQMPFMGTEAAARNMSTTA